MFGTLQVYFGAHGHTDGVWFNAEQLRYHDSAKQRVLVYPGTAPWHPHRNLCLSHPSVDADLTFKGSHVFVRLTAFGQVIYIATDSLPRESRFFSCKDPFGRQLPEFGG